MSQQTLTLAICKGTLVAYTYGRLNQNEIHDDLYKYDIQSSDDGLEPLAIRPLIRVNHWGSLISREPLPLDETGWLMLDEETDFIELSHIPITQEEYRGLSQEVFDAFLENRKEENQNYANHQL